MNDSPTKSKKSKKNKKMKKDSSSEVSTYSSTQSSDILSEMSDFDPIIDDKKAKFLASLNKEELDRYESFRRSTFSQSEIKKLILSTINQSVNPNFVIVMSSLAKVFSAELIFEASKVKKEYNDVILKSEHVDEAFRRLMKTMPLLKKEEKRIFR